MCIQKISSLRSPPKVIVHFHLILNILWVVRAKMLFYRALVLTSHRERFCYSRPFGTSHCAGENLHAPPHLICACVRYSFGLSQWTCPCLSSGAVTPRVFTHGMRASQLRCSSFFWPEVIATCLKFTRRRLRNCFPNRPRVCKNKKIKPHFLFWMSFSKGYLMTWVLNAEFWKSSTPACFITTLLYCRQFTCYRFTLHAALFFPPQVNLLHALWCLRLPPFSSTFTSADKACPSWFI